MLYNVRNRGANPLFVILYILQEFQYGKDIVQTTTNKMRGEMPSRMEIWSSKNRTLFGYGNIEWQAKE